MKVTMSQGYADRIPFITKQIENGVDEISARKAAEKKFGVKHQSARFKKIYAAIKAGTITVTVDRTTNNNKEPKATKRKYTKKTTPAHLAELGAKTLPVSLFHPVVSQMQRLCKANNCVIEVSPDGVHMAEMPPKSVEQRL